ncbi:outer membrane beta-barrel protein [Dysgonomonas sp. Marseille-P4677]|uniref:outer membrane beta-barrel protein n=1 Tax=Dysgonomonas sp. Marseille-P4677 TaxID=2364790 RepID=UPI0019142E02|nr:outer membrane beta-barrel protein [Dysgonomonas sp. Marseille-P4677]MBK5719247.1 outer membrane beta-barrel protein [Dysgonomonas sp. Marseille-P4677]
MKKILTTLLFCFTIAISVYSQDQTEKFSLAGNLNYGTKVESIGIGLRAQYGFTEHLRGTAEYKYYVDRHNLSAWGVNADGHYVFGVSETVSLYPIAGVNYTRWTYDPGRSNGLGYKYSDNRLGLNIGFGGQVNVAENSFIQIEAKEALIKNYSQFVLSVGFMYQF